MAELVELFGSDSEEDVEQQLQSDQKIEPDAPPKDLRARGVDLELTRPELKFSAAFPSKLPKSLLIASEEFAGASETRDVSSTIRWRRNAKGVKESNSRLVQWSDGSWQLLVGKDAFDVSRHAISSDRDLRLYQQIDESALVSVSSRVQERFTIKASSLSVVTDKLKKYKAEQAKKEKRATLKAAVGFDFQKKLEEDLKKRHAEEKKLKRISDKNKASAVEQFSRFLEREDDDSELDRYEEDFVDNDLDVSGSEEEIERPPRRAYDDFEASERLNRAKKGAAVRRQAPSRSAPSNDLDSNAEEEEASHESAELKIAKRRRIAFDEDEDEDEE